MPPTSPATRSHAIAIARNSHAVSTMSRLLVGWLAAFFAAPPLAGRPFCPVRPVCPERPPALPRALVPPRAFPLPDRPAPALPPAAPPEPPLPAAEPAPLAPPRPLFDRALPEPRRAPPLLALPGGGVGSITSGDSSL